eukprot:2970601-Prymnesium_polylepis.1
MSSATAVRKSAWASRHATHFWCVSRRLSGRGHIGTEGRAERSGAQVANWRPNVSAWPIARQRSASRPFRPAFFALASPTSSGNDVSAGCALHTSPRTTPVSKVTTLEKSRHASPALQPVAAKHAGTERGTAMKAILLHVTPHTDARRRRCICSVVSESWSTLARSSVVVATPVSGGGDRSPWLRSSNERCGP